MPLDFTPQMKKEYTIIAPDIFPTHMELIQAVFRMYGYHLVIAHYEGKKVIDTGLKYVHNDMVSSFYPVRIFENRIHYLVYNDKIMEKYISLDNITKDEFVRAYNGVPVSKE